MSPESQLLAWMDWISHLAISPGARIDMAREALTLVHDCAKAHLFTVEGQEQCPGEMPDYDRRFKDPAWDRYPYNVLRRTFLLQQKWWEYAVDRVDGVSAHHKRLVSFATKQWLDMFSPGNFLATNPEVMDKTMQEGGANLARGFQHFMEDVRARIDGTPPPGTEQFKVGQDVATTPGKVVFRNRLIELIQYEPTTEKVYPEPVLIVPAWIMKYYILDLQPERSLIKYLVDQGHTVFAISWKNPGADESELGMDDYLQMGWNEALDAVNAIVSGEKVHATGYCLGGTLLSVAAAAMARDGDDRLKSISLLAAQTDFSEAGELGLFIDESQLNLLEAQMNQAGYLRADQMAGAFQMLRSYDLLWSRLVNEYLLGDRAPLNALMAWNADATRMPAKMHAQYLRRFYLNNDLSAGRYEVGDRRVNLGNLRLPTFVVGTASDHVAPWESVYKVHSLMNGEITFVLTSGGHNGGIVSPVGHPRRRYQIATQKPEDKRLWPEEWQEKAPIHEGSWWPAWEQWLVEYSGKKQLAPSMGAPEKGYVQIEDAPGQYVLEK